MNNDQALELIEGALRETPTCDCGAATVPVDHADVIWLECSTLAARRGVLRQLLTLDFAAAHSRRPVVDASHLAVAA
ncbi:MAG: hypothetical protein IVW53_03195 [Chloroflexi bacterium]|nr:hypothetical protein [Chloroflexota bacterium]